MTVAEQQIAKTICNSIKENRIIKFFYSDTTKNNNDWRMVEPHLIGINKTTDRAQLRSWFLPLSNY